MQQYKVYEGFYIKIKRNLKKGSNFRNVKKFEKGKCEEI